MQIPEKTEINTKLRNVMRIFIKELHQQSPLETDVSDEGYGDQAQAQFTLHGVLGQSGRPELPFLSILSGEIN